MLGYKTNKEKMIKNKRAWIRIVEAFVAIMLIAAVLLTIVNKNIPEKKDISVKVYDTEDAILKSITLDDNMRREVLLNPKTNFDDTTLVSKLINAKTPDYLKCVIRTCNLDKTEECDSSAGQVLVLSTEQDIYTKSIIISSEKDGNADFIPYQLRLLKIFCGLKAEALKSS